MLATSRTGSLTRLHWRCGDRAIDASANSRRADDRLSSLSMMLSMLATVDNRELTLLEALFDHVVAADESLASHRDGRDASRARRDDRERWMEGAGIATTRQEF
jgi:hypothetical protein